MRKGDKVKIVQLSSDFSEVDDFSVMEGILTSDIFIGGFVIVENNALLEDVKEILPNNCFKTLNSLYKIIYL